MNENKWQIRYRESCQDKHEVLPLATSVSKETIDLSHYGLEETTKENGYWTLMLGSVPICRFCPVCLGKAK